MKRNIPFEEAFKNCGATFLRYDSTPLLCYRAAKEYVDEYEKEYVDAYEHEQRHVAQEREEPKVGDIYRDVFGRRLVVTEIGSMNYGTRKNVIFYNKEDQRKLPLEEFVRCFQKV